MGLRPEDVKVKGMSSSSSRANLRPEDVKLKGPSGPSPGATRYPPPQDSWFQNPRNRKILAVALPLLGFLLLFWRMQPVKSFVPPPKAVEVRNLRMSQIEDLPVLEGEVSNGSGRPAKKLTFLVEFRAGGKDYSQYLVVSDVADGANVPFSMPLAVSKPGGDFEVGPGKLPSLEGTPTVKPFDSKW